MKLWQHQVDKWWLVKKASKKVFLFSSLVIECCSVLTQWCIGIIRSYLSTSYSMCLIVESMHYGRFRVVYRLVNTVYVLGITSADLDDDTNIFECAGTVNQAVRCLFICPLPILKSTSVKDCFVVTDQPSEMPRL